MKCRDCKNNTLREEDGKQFTWCKAIHDNLDIDEERKCEHYVAGTNADRIRAMTDEELANMFAKIALDNGCCDGGFLFTKCDILSCYDCWFYYLKTTSNSQT